MSDIALFLAFMLPGTVFLGMNDVLVRRVLRSGTSSSQLLLIYEYGSAALLVSLMLFVTGIPEIRPGFWSAAAITIVLNVFAQWAWYSAFAREEASLVSPLRLITPPLVIITGYLVLNEVPSLFGAAGIVLTMFGLWTLFYGEARASRVAVRNVMRRPGMLLALWGAVSFAISFPFDKKVVLTSSPLFAVAVVVAGLAFGSGIVFLLRGGKTMRLAFRESRGALIAIPFVHTAASLLTYAALQYSLAAYAASVKRLWPLWAVLFAGTFLKEGNIRNKLLATAVMLAGIALTVVLG